jgi:ribosome recycling factor
MNRRDHLKEFREALEKVGYKVAYITNDNIDEFSKSEKPKFIYLDELAEYTPEMQEMIRKAIINKKVSE